MDEMEKALLSSLSYIFSQFLLVLVSSHAFSFIILCVLYSSLKYSVTVLDDYTDTTPHVISFIILKNILQT